MKHRLFLVVYLASLLPAIAIATLSPKAAAAIPAKPVDPDVQPLTLRIEQAMRKVDLPALAKLYGESNPVAHALAAMAIERAHFNLDKSSEIAHLCESSLIDTRPSVAFYCARFATGNLRLAGKRAAADQAELDIAERFKGHVPQAALDSMSRFVTQQSTTPPMQLHRPDNGFVIPLQDTLVRRGTVEVEAGGRKALLEVDTGSSDLVLDRATADKLGVHINAGNRTINGLLSRKVPVQTGMLDRLSFAGVTVEHVPVTVIEGSSRLLGIDILKQLGAFRIARKQITVYGRNEPLPTCKDPMLVSSSMWGNELRVVAMLPVDGVPRATLLDSGNSFYLNGNQAALAQLKTGYNNRINVGDVGPYRHDARFNQATASILISGQPIKVTFAVFKDADLPWDYILGAGALDDMDFYFDFDHRHTCLLLHDHLY